MQVSRMCQCLVHNHLLAVHLHLMMYMIVPTCHRSRRDHMHDYDYCMCNLDRNRRSWARRDRWGACYDYTVFSSSLQALCPPHVSSRSIVVYMYIVETYVIIVTYISSRNLVVYIRTSNLVEKIAPGGLTNSALHATLA